MGEGGTGTTTSRRAARTRRLAPCALLALLGMATAAEAGEERAELEPDRETRVDFDLGWDRGLTYEARGHVPFSSLGAPAWMDDVHLRGRIGGSLYLDGGWTSGTPGQGDGAEFEVRRARVYTRGVFRYAFPIEYKVEFSLENDRFLLNDFYLGWEPARFAERLRFGYFDPPATLQNLASSSSRVLMEVASPVAAFAPGYRLGVDARGRFEDASVSWFLNLATVGQEAEVGDASDEKLRLYGRLAWQPFGRPTPDAPLLHLGLSTSYAPDAGSTTIRYRSRPESFLTGFVVDTDDLEGSAGVLGLEAAWRDGPRILQGELLVSAVDSEEGGDPFFYGLYLQASWTLTGEVRRYDAREAVLGRVVPEEPFAPRAGRWGALELGARLSWLDLSDADVRGGEMLSFTVGPAWTLNRSVRLLAGYVVARVRAAPDAGTLHLLQARLELTF